MTDVKAKENPPAATAVLAAPASGADHVMAKDAEARRAEIIAAAHELYGEKGLAQTSIKDITERVGVTRSLFYHYFPNKEAVTSAVLDSYADDFVEALHYWNADRHEGDINHALSTVVRLLRLGLFENDAFRTDLASRENAALYLEFVNRVAEQTSEYIIESTVQDYAARHEVRIEHLHETFYILILGVIGYLRKHPDADDQVIADVIAQTLHMDRP